MDARTADRTPPHREPPRPPLRRRRILLYLALLLLPVLCLEAGVRVLIALDRLPVAAAHTETTEIKWTRFANLPGTDILLLGPSTMNAAIDPAVLAELASDALGRKVTAFNMGIPGLAREPRLVEELARAGRVPPVVLIAISPGIRDDGADDVAVGEGTDGTGSFLASPMGQLFGRCADLPEPGWVSWTDCAAGLVSAAWRWRGRPGEVLGAMTRPRDLASVEGRRRPDGFGGGPSSSIAEVEAQIPTGLARDPGPTLIGEGSLDRFRRIADAVRAAGGTPIGVLIGYAPPYMAALEERYPGFRQAWLDGAAQIGAEAGMEIVDPGPFDPWWGEGSSEDIRHLSRDGAVDFTRSVWAAPGLAPAVLRALGGTATRPSASPDPA